MAPTPSQPTRVVVHNRLGTSVHVGHFSDGAVNAVASGRVSLPQDQPQPQPLTLLLDPIDLRTSHRLCVTLANDASQKFVIEFAPVKQKHKDKALALAATTEEPPCLSWATSRLHAHPVTPFRSMMSAPDAQGTRHLLLFAAPVDKSKFTSLLPATTLLSAICLPGTHQSLALYGAISQCQTATLTSQLQAGIRFLDLRTTLKGEAGQEKLLAYHGIADQKRELGDALDEVYRWLDGPGRNETVIVSLKPDSASGPWATLLWDRHIQPNQARWWLNDSIPSLGQVRGKCVMFSRWIPLPGKPAGINSTKWPDSFDGSFSYTISSGQRVLTQDWYDVKSLSALPHKVDLINSVLSEAGSDAATLTINFTSCSSFPLAPPNTAALGRFTSGPSWLKVTGMNARLRDLVASRLMIRAAGLELSGSPDNEERKHRGSPISTASLLPQVTAASPRAVLTGLASVFAVDFYDAGETPDLASLLVAANFGP